MRLVDWRTILVAAIAGAGVMISTAGAQAHDDDRWERRHHYKDKHDHWRHHDRPPRVVYERAPRVVYERAPQVVYERQPVVVAPPPVYLAPMAPTYGPPADPSLNLNFNIPLR
ncbi:hypothetical protein [Reyranella sp.]|uniref:hypothetical protein n=1 Tax=Reyranella sp. TaxID=1929291 RepID=UPI00378335D9